MKKLPIGIQSFEKLRSEDFLYVDKTREILELTSSNIIFLSRPRRFGKSLLISTLQELYKGNKSLFEGLYIYDKWDWTQQYPVIRIDWTQIRHGSKEEMEQSMLSFLKRYADLYDISLVSKYASDSFAELIESLHRKTGKKVVVLIDEYDKPILDSMEKPEAAGVREFLQSFYVVLKGSDDHLKFILLTGVTKVAKVSIFSVLNSTDDITLNNKYASICGYTQEELERDFSEHINDTALNVDMTRGNLLNKIRELYDGYTWDGKTPVYNPFSTLMFFGQQMFSNYWFETGTPTFLINRLKKHGLAKTVLEPVTVGASAFNSYDPDELEDLPLLFQTGYLTIKNKEMIEGDPQYTLEVPNFEVKESLMRHLLNAYTGYPMSRMLELSKNMLRQMSEYDADGLQDSLSIMLAGVPFKLRPEKSSEARFHIMFQVWMTLLGFEIQSEKSTDKGIIDAVLNLQSMVVVVELKYHATTKLDTLLDQAIAQIYEKRYYEQFLDRKVILLGIAFNGKEVSCRIEPLK
ncbi:ATPase AAA [Bacteroidia bacterium]|nr:ATPase AAA [Bacteroidia bacterium]